MSMGAFPAGREKQRPQAVDLGTLGGERGFAESGPPPRAARGRYFKPSAAATPAA